MTSTLSLGALLALVDQRLPTGGHAHSAGVEQAVTEGRVTDVGSLRVFLRQRLFTSGLVSAALAAAAVTVTPEYLPVLDEEADARMPSPTARNASRAQGRGLLRIAISAWAAPSPDIAWSDCGARPHHSITLGLCCRAAGMAPEAAALAAAYLSVTGPCTAAQRILALDPIAVAVTSLDLTADIATVAAEAAGAAAGPMRELPSDSSPLLDLLTERHALRTDRLFAS
jgi:urease accessory protein